jgi:hypothetical protein
MKKVISMIVAIAMLVTMFSTVINLGTAFAAQDYETVAFSYEDQASNANASNGGYSKSIPAGVLGWAKYGYDNAIAQMENAGITSFAPTSASTGFTVNFDSVAGKSGDTITVPINLVNVPSVGISTANMTIEYDATKLKYVSYEAGSIITNAATNFEINQPSDGTLKVLFLDYTMKTQAIKEDGIFATLTFKVIGDEGMADVEVTKSTFGDNDLSRYEVTLENGGVNIGSAPEGFTISGHINPDFMTTSTTAPIVNEGFKVEIVEANKSVATDNKGYFEIKDIAAGTYTVKITKDNYLTRIIESVTVSDNKEMSTSAEPILMWAGDMIINGAQDGAINLEDIMEVCKAFNTASTDSKYKEDLDLNKDGAINLEDVMIIARHFNKVSSDY